jgi:hypothetical protein
MTLELDSVCDVEEFCGGKWDSLDLNSMKSMWNSKEGSLPKTCIFSMNEVFLFCINALYLTLL